MELLRCQRSIIMLFFFFVLMFVSVFAKTGPPHDKIVVCYISTWAVYRPGHGAYSIENFDPSLCTHAVYAFAGLDITQSAIKSLDPWQDFKEDYGKGGYERLTSLKKTNAHLKVSLAIGGWNEGSKNYSILSADSSKRKKFAKQVTGYLLKHNFDGLDLDWEYPTQRGGEPKDRENFVLLAKDLREELDKHHLLLTSAFAAPKKVIDEAYDIVQLSKYFDYLHIMCYDYHGNWDRKVGANAPLAIENDILNVKFTIDYLIKLGAPASKLVMGVPFYGRTFITLLQGKIGDDTDEVGFQGPFTREYGFLGYNEICQMVYGKDSGWIVTWNESISQVIARLPPPNGTEFTKVITFDNTRSIANKIKFAMERELAGVMVWSIDTDDFLGECSPELDTFADYTSTRTYNGLSNSKRLNSYYPLLKTINEATVLALEEVKTEKTKINQDKENEIPKEGKESKKGESAATCMFFQVSNYICFSVIMLFTCINLPF